MGLEKINEMRKIRGLTINELSKKSGIPKGTLSKITAGITKRPSIKTVQTIVHCMGFTLEDLDRDITKPPVDHNGLLGEKDVSDIYNFLNDGLIAKGLIKPGKDITAEQSEIIVSVSRIINAAFQ